MKNKTFEPKPDTRPSLSHPPAERAEAQQTQVLRPDPLERTPAPPGSEATIRAHAAGLNRATAGPALRRLQRQYGNRYVQRVVELAQRRGGGEGFTLDAETAGRINRARGGGQPLDGAVQAQMSEALGHDFSGVRVHTDAEADDLNQRISAWAFTTGQDIFFRQGEYSPGSGSGRDLIAHELGHVVQQTTGRVSGGGTGMSVRPAGDAFEQEAGRGAEEATRATYNWGQEQTSHTQYVEIDPPPLQRAVARPSLASPVDVLTLQRTVCNRVVATLLAGEAIQPRAGAAGSNTTHALVPLEKGAGSVVQRYIFSTNHELCDQPRKTGAIDDYGTYRSLDVAVAAGGGEILRGKTPAEGKTLLNMGAAEAKGIKEAMRTNEDIYLVGHGKEGQIGGVGVTPAKVAEKVIQIVPEGWSGSVHSFNCWSGYSAEGTARSPIQVLYDSLKTRNVDVAMTTGPEGRSLRHRDWLVQEDWLLGMKLVIGKLSSEAEDEYARIKAQALKEFSGQSPVFRENVNLFRRKSIVTMRDFEEAYADVVVGKEVVGVREKATLATEFGRELQTTIIKKVLATPWEKLGAELRRGGAVGIGG